MSSDSQTEKLTTKRTSSIKNLTTIGTGNPLELKAGFGCVAVQVISNPASRATTLSNIQSTGPIAFHWTYDKHLPFNLSAISETVRSRQSITGQCRDFGEGRQLKIMPSNNATEIKKF